MNEKVFMAYLIAGNQNKFISHAKALFIAKRFTLHELERIYASYHPKQSHVIRVSNKLGDLTGVGTEYLTINEHTTIKFYNGNVASDKPVGDSEKTLNLAG